MSHPITRSSLKRSISCALDDLLSLDSNPTQVSSALEQLQNMVNSLALDTTMTSGSPSMMDVFLKLQGSFEWNIAIRLIEWLGRSTLQLRSCLNSGEMDAIKEMATRCVRLLQGLILLHRPSQKLFAQRAPVETLLSLLEHSQPTTLSHASPLSSTTPSRPSPSPSTSTLPISSPLDPSVALSLILLDTCLCTLVDQPCNVRIFEAAGGLKAVVKVLKDKLVAKAVRIKAIEILYYYLLPESSAATSKLASDPPPIPMLLASTLGDFVPQTPMRPRYHHHQQQSRMSSFSSSAGTPTSPRPTTPPRSMPSSPSRSQGRFSEKRASYSRDVKVRETAKENGVSKGARGVEYSTPQKQGSSYLRAATPSTPPRSPRLVSPSKVYTYAREQVDEGARYMGTRSTDEKRAMLQNLMGNVDALEERFRAMRRM